MIINIKHSDCGNNYHTLYDIDVIANPLISFTFPVLWQEWHIAGGLAYLSLPQPTV